MFWKKLKRTVIPRDEILGMVTRIIDGDIFDIYIIHQSRYNRRTYNKRERVRITKSNFQIKGSSLLSPQQKLERIIQGKSVQVIVKSRDYFGRLKGKVKVGI